MIATVAVSFLIYWLQSKHEKEIRNIEEARRKQDLEEKASIFLMDNEEERNYLPWCILAANLHRLEKHKRKIYNEYCHCSLELQNEILKKSGFSIKQIEGTDWVDKCFIFLKSDIKKYEMGEDYLYEGEKYFNRGYEYYRNNTWNNPPAKFIPIVNLPLREAFNITRIDISTYIDEYLYYYIDGNIPFEEDKPQPPMDYVWQYQNLAYENEEKVCMWIMELVDKLSISLMRKNKFDETMMIEVSDAVAETFEDKYYSALQSLYNTYNSLQPLDKKELKKKRKKER